MKNKHIICVLIIFICNGIIFPVVTFKAGVERAGVSISSGGNNEWNKYSRSRIGLGFSSLKKRSFSFQPELYYVCKGAQATGNYLNTDIVQKIKIEYIELPVLFRYSIINNNKINAGILFGPFIASRLSAAQKTIFGGESKSEDLKDDFKKTDIGTVLGFEIALKRKKFNLFFDIRFTSGLINIKENRDFSGDIKTRSFSILAGIGF